MNGRPADSPAVGFPLPEYWTANVGPLLVNGRQHRAHCPNPSHLDRRPSCDLAFVKDRWVFLCRSCGVRGDIIDLLVLTGVCMDRPAAFRHLRGAPAARLRPAFPVPEPAERFAPLEPLPERQQPDGAEEMMATWARSRGWTDWAVSTYGLRVVLDDDGRPCVSFPWRERHGKTVFEQLRRIDPCEKAHRWRSTTGVRVPGPFGMERIRLLDELAARPTEFDSGSDLFLVEGVSDCVAMTDGLAHHEATSMTVVLGLVGGQLKRDWYRYCRDRFVFVITDNDASGLGHRQRLRSQLDGTAAGVVDVFVPDAHNDVADWRLAAGDRFASELVGAVADSLEAVQ